jgi:hypothetical protein
VSVIESRAVVPARVWSWTRFLIWAATLHFFALVMYWAWREEHASARTRPVTDLSADEDAIPIRLAPTARAHTRSDEPLTSPENDLAVRTIASEIADLHASHPWAGDYFDCSETGGGRELMLAPKSGFALAFNGELGSVFTIHGTVREVAGLVELNPAVGSDNIDDGPELPTYLVPVEWSGRHHLIEPRRWQRWLNFAKREWGECLTGLDRGDFWLRRGDVLGEHTGPSHPPAAYRAAWPARLQAHVVSVISGHLIPGSCLYSTAIELDLGTRDGIEPPARLFVDEMADLDQPVHLIAATEHRSTAELLQDQQDPRVPHVGWTCSNLPNLH